MFDRVAPGRASLFGALVLRRYGVVDGELPFGVTVTMA